MATTKATSARLHQLLGARIREIRMSHGMSQDRLAQRMRDWAGLNWTRGMLAKIERGERDVTLEEFFALGIVLALPLAQLIPDKAGPVSLSPEASVDAGMLANLLQGHNPGRATPAEAGLDSPLTRLVAKYLPGMQRPQDARAETVTTATKALRRQGFELTPDDVGTLSQRLWGRSLLEERERRLERSVPTRGRRGHITRSLVNELAATLTTGSPIPGAKQAKQRRKRV